jgi:hypothetical protein
MLGGAGRKGRGVEWRPTAIKKMQTKRHGITDQRLFNANLLLFILSGVRLSPLGTAATTGQPQMTDDGDCGAIGGMKIGRGSRSTRTKPAAPPLCPSQIPRPDPVSTQASAVGSQRLTA